MNKNYQYFVIFTPNKTLCWIDTNHATKQNRNTLVKQKSIPRALVYANKNVIQNKQIWINITIQFCNLYNDIFFQIYLARQQNWTDSHCCCVWVGFVLFFLMYIGYKFAVKAEPKLKCLPVAIHTYTQTKPKHHSCEGVFSQYLK